jgi:hypothetical protein
MTNSTIEMLTPERVTELWPQLEPFFIQSCNSNEIARDELTPESIHELAATGMCAVFAAFEKGMPACAMAIQFNMTNGLKGADVIALGGRSLLKFKSQYWAPILDWLRANEIKFLDAYATERLAKVYLGKFGFNKSCAYVRMNL